MFDSITKGVKSVGSSIGKAAGSIVPKFGDFDPGMAGELMSPHMPKMPHVDPGMVGELMAPKLPFPSMGPIAELLSGLPSLPHVDPSMAGEIMAPGLGGIGSAIGGLASGIGSGIGGALGGIAGGLGGGLGGIAELMGGLPSMPDIDFSQAGELMGAWPF